MKENSERWRKEKLLPVATPSARNDLVKSQFVELKKILDKPPVIFTAPPPTDTRPIRNVDKPRDRDEITPLPDAAEWEAFDAARQAMGPKLSRSRAAARYQA